MLGISYGTEGHAVILPTSPEFLNGLQDRSGEIEFSQNACSYARDSRSPLVLVETNRGSMLRGVREASEAC